MLLAPLAFATADPPKPVNQYTLDVLGDTFVVRKGGQKETLLRVPRDEKPRAELSFRKDRRWVVWDERGLTTRDGDWTSTDRLESLAVSPRLQSRTDILDAVARMHRGTRHKWASGLSGARRIGSMVYLLPRWDDAKGSPWLEALVAVDLGKPHPKPRLLGRFGGLSLSRGMVDDRLEIENGALTLSVNGPDGWGEATYQPAKAHFGFAPRGVRLLARDRDRVIESTSYGTTLVGREAAGRTVPWLETHGPATFVPGEGPVLVCAGDRLHNAVTGAVIRLAPQAAIRRSRFGLLVFWPEAAPQSARLLDPSRFEERARWEKGTK